MFILLLFTEQTNQMWQKIINFFYKVENHAGITHCFRLDAYLGLFPYKRQFRKAIL